MLQTLAAPSPNSPLQGLQGNTEALSKELPVTVTVGQEETETSEVEGEC